MNPENFGKNIQAILDCLELTQDEFAKRCELTPSAISMICAGKREPMLKTVVKICETLGCSFERLLR